MDRWLAAAGMPHDAETVARLRRAYLAEFEADPLGGEYRVFEEVMPALARLREAGVKRAVISNADDDVTQLCTRLAFAHEMEAIITSALVGYEKPDPRTFHAALDHPAIATPAADALHVGDQPRSDAVGALGVGMRAALIDRYDRYHDAALGAIAPAAFRTRSLLALVDVVVRHNAAVS
jgi:HAD superfamily hydrolase (TIGR01549 family)